ncbi:LacI family DNA-binding transcriptional regulator [Roseateles chitinivorans]|uniref:LacI family DNA-binding transcriptional regulator n=1 Tax=Roseateles chitinivorans TaxID=2917965 RepID=UPI003D666E4C
MPPIKSPATLRDVAELAGVSTAAVSKYVNGKQRFTAAVERRIAEAIDQVGYRSNLAARSMVTGRSGAIAALVYGVENPYTAAVIKGASRAATALGYDLLFVDLLQSESPDRELARVTGMQVDGIVLAAALPAEARQLLSSYGRPFVDLNRASEPSQAPGGEEQAAAMLGRYLLSLGHRDIAYIACEAQPGNAERLLGMQRALQAAGVALTVHLVTSPTAEEGARVASSLLLGQKRPQAIATCNDLIAMGLMSEARHLGLSVPEDVSVAGIENMPFGRFLSPPLTSVDLHADALGEWAMRDLIATIAGEDAPVRGHDLTPRLVVRGSTRAAD